MAMPSPQTMTVTSRWVALTVSEMQTGTCTRPSRAALKKLPMASLAALVMNRMTTTVVSAGMAPMDCPANGLEQVEKEVAEAVTERLGKRKARQHEGQPEIGDAQP
jgi:uncharacterized membrane protein